MRSLQAFAPTLTASKIALLKLLKSGECEVAISAAASHPAGT
jgi:hypothetical protein